ncbi:Ldh family oxidoreductase [Paeniglutamicibacter sp. ABSL32-1]|uniref:Ldh family oxidoreductase n=1 Tax=Paeniglutamicibacter quisquiliarum TaxID=2849498 RepID=UPI001C2D7A19|nr:Ldh family oxidoreductase [Paeniglutamicibacter quisquiliarum]MBV1777647.1 Ldh family oxidoreductase [Paeniglutamicibacter quisquiliarum]
MITLTLEEATKLCIRAAVALGASKQSAVSLAQATVDAEAAGAGSLGFLHFFDYLDALRDGRIAGSAEPTTTRPAKAIILSDAAGGIAHLGFDNAFEDIVETTQDLGVAVFSQRNAYTCGALGYFVDRLARRDLLSFAVANAPAQVVTRGAQEPVYGTNPMAFGAPLGVGIQPLLIDQSSSATAFANIRQAAGEGRELPKGWAVDKHGRPTTNSQEALMGALLTFGGSKGANIAMMVEILATASGASWSLDAPSYLEGETSPAVGLFILAIKPELLNAEFGSRLAAHLGRLHTEHGVHVPGSRQIETREQARDNGLTLDKDIHERLLSVNNQKTTTELGPQPRFNRHQ